MWELDYKESWAPKNWCFWTVMLEKKLLKVPWIARRSNHFILKEISPEYSLERLMLKRKLPYFGHLIRRTDSLEKTLMLGKIEGRRRGQQRTRWLDGITDSRDMSLSKRREMIDEGQGSLACCSPWDSQESSLTPQFKSINFSALSFLHSPTLSYMTTGKTIALTRWTFVGKVMSLLLNMLSRFV